MWRRNDVIGCNEYLISRLSESAIFQVYSLQFLFKSAHHSWRYERKCEWIFSEHSVVMFSLWVFCTKSRYWLGITCDVTQTLLNWTWLHETVSMIEAVWPFTGFEQHMSLPNCIEYQWNWHGFHALPFFTHLASHSCWQCVLNKCVHFSLF